MSSENVRLKHTFSSPRPGNNWQEKVETEYDDLRTAAVGKRGRRQHKITGWRSQIEEHL